MNYTEEELVGIYELGRLYLEMGYFTAAERIFNGLISVDNGMTPGRLGLGVVKLERGLHEESMVHFRKALEHRQFAIPAQLGMCAAFIGAGDFVRAKSILVQVAPDLEASRMVGGDLRTLWEALAIRCS